MQPAANDAKFKTKQQYAAEWLRMQIVSGVALPGERIKPQKIARELGMSVTPVREAIVQLQNEGYLDLEHHVGSSVARLSLDGISEQYFLRSFLEGHLASRAAARSNADLIVKLDALSRDYARAALERDVHNRRAANHAFHRAIWEAAGQPVTVEMVTRLWTRFPWELAEAGVHGRSMESVAEHERIIRAFASADPTAAEVAMRSHIDAGQVALDRAQDRV
jgi:DNA-binding GntR family transcriptional regulator